MILDEIFDLMIKENASDAFLRAGATPRLRVFTEVKELGERVLTAKEIEEAVSKVLGPKEREALEKKRGTDCAVDFKENWRFRLGVFYQQGGLAVERRVDRRLVLEPVARPPDVLGERIGERGHRVPARLLRPVSVRAP